MKNVCHDGMVRALLITQNPGSITDKSIRVRVCSLDPRIIFKHPDEELFDVLIERIAVMLGSRNLAETREWSHARGCGARNAFNSIDISPDMTDFVKAAAAREKWSMVEFTNKKKIVTLPDGTTEDVSDICGGAPGRDARWDDEGNLLKPSHHEDRETKRAISFVPGFWKSSLEMSTPKSHTEYFSRRILINRISRGFTTQFGEALTNSNIFDAYNKIDTMGIVVSDRGWRPRKKLPGVNFQKMLKEFESSMDEIWL